MYQSHLYLEVRILLSAEKKAFCPCVPAGKADKNADGCAVCRREPGARPVLDRSAAEKAYALAGSLGCVILEESEYEALTGNLNLPEGYPLSGLSLRIAADGVMAIEFHRRKKNIHIEEIRIEEDTGRLTHSDGNTRMDYTWAGCASVRIRTGADFELGEEAELFLDELRRRIQYMKLVSGVPVDSVIRCNAYVALARYPDKPSYYVKLRNLNSFNFVRKAINAEIDRQEEILTSGGTVPSESRLWNERQNRTEPYRSRKTGETGQFESLDPRVRYTADSAFSAAARSSMVELPEERKKRFFREYGLARNRAGFSSDEKDRADFFERAVAAGADPMDAAHWITSTVTSLLRRAGMQTGSSPLTAERFASVIQLFSSKQIHSGMARQLLQTVIETDTDPETILKKNRWTQISDETVLRPLIRKTLAEHHAEAEKLRDGDMAPLEFLTGLVMKKTGGMAVPQKVKELLKEELHISLVYVMSMGGTICGCVHGTGSAVPAGDCDLVSLISREGLPEDVRFQSVPVRLLFSEETEPADWAALIAEISAKIAAGTATGIVVAHGTDTLSYTASLLFWLFSESEVPVVITSSSSSPGMSGEAEINMNLAVRVACREKKGVYAVFGGKVLSPLNLKFERFSPDGFSNWNMKEPVFCGSGLFSGFQDTDVFVMTQVLREAADRLFVCRVYPGLRSELFLPLIDEGVKYIFLELYETGTASMRTGPYSLKPLLIRGRKKGCRFYCTSQQHSRLDFSGYATSRRVWREGVVPMGSLTTESAIALYFAASLVCDTAEELDQCMETGSEIAG